MESEAYQAELRSINDRMAAIERGAQAASSAEIERNIKTQTELARLDEGLKGVREQAKSHNESTGRALAEMKDQMAQNRLAVESVIQSNVNELHGGIDRISRALGLDDDPRAGQNIRENLKTLAEMLQSRKEDILWIRRGVITLVVSAVGMAVLAGAKYFLMGH